MPGRTAKITHDLTDAQREAVCYGEGPLLVVAGAGSGKTRVITRRIAWLLEQGVPPDRVVAMTFTNKAADEMRRRVEALMGEDVHLSTFHSFCALLLRRHIARLGRESSFTIYDRADTLRVVRQAAKDMELDTATYRPDAILDFIAAHKDRVEGPEECAQRAMGIEEQALAGVYRAYEEKLAGANALDFDDLLLKVLEVFRQCPDVLQHYQDAYLHVLVDEYQDTNLPQHLIARALQGKHRNITAVGDPDQMIYSWRGARLENLMEFEQDFPGTHVVTLERNYRSTANILGAAHACISRNVFRRPKELHTEREDGSAVLVGEFADSFAEGRWVADRAHELIEGGLSPRDIAVFYRTKNQSLPFEDAFASLALPHQVVDSVGFFARREVKDLRSYLQLLVNPKDDVACLRVINAPPRGIGDRTVALLQAAARRRRQSLMEAVRDAQELQELNPRARKALAAFWALYGELSRLEWKGAADLIRRLLKLTEYVQRQPREEREDAQEIVDQFIGYAREYDRRSPPAEGSARTGLVGFLEQAALVSDVDGWNARANAVPFMTLHSAKGLEFDAVFIVGLEDDLLPHRRAIEEHAHSSQDVAIEEERRLFYVGMTRARHKLSITYAQRRVLRGREEPTIPSRFLAELSPAGVEWLSGGQSTPVAAAARGFAEDMQQTLQKKRASLRILDGKRLARGIRVSHSTYGEGEVLECAPVGKRQMVRIRFDLHGPMAFLLAPTDIGCA